MKPLGKVAQRDAAWAAHKAACDARFNHVHADRCETCWSGDNGNCAAWVGLTLNITRTCEEWIKL